VKLLLIAILALVGAAFFGVKSWSQLMDNTDSVLAGGSSVVESLPRVQDQSVPSKPFIDWKLIAIMYDKSGAFSEGIWLSTDGDWHQAGVRESDPFGGRIFGYDESGIKVLGGVTWNL
jgi:hypothetical protein